MTELEYKQFALFAYTGALLMGDDIPFVRLLFWPLLLSLFESLEFSIDKIIIFDLLPLSLFIYKIKTLFIFQAEGKGSRLISEI